MHTIPNAVDLGQLDRLATAADGAALRRPGETVLLSVGRLEENKGFHVLAAALGALRERGISDRRRVAVGDRGHRTLPRDASNGRSRMPGLAPALSSLDGPATAELHAWYEAADVFVHPTLYEGSSLVTLEAMAHRRACVVTRAGGLPDKVTNGVNGWIVAPGDPSALAAAISGALSDPERRVTMGQAGRAIVEREFSWTAAADRTLRLYADLLSRGE